MGLEDVEKSLRSKSTPVRFKGLVIVMLAQKFLPIGFRSPNMSHLLFYGILVVDPLCIFPT